MDLHNTLRTWIEIDKRAAAHNAAVFRSLIPKETQLMSVVKSNAYGHGIFTFPRFIEQYVDRFGVDSIVEALTLRKEGIRIPILVLGATLESRLEEARRHDIAITVSTLDLLSRLAVMKHPPRFHLKVDTGMRRQGFTEEDVPTLIAFLKKNTSLLKALEGGYTHFARAKAERPDRHTRSQIRTFLGIEKQLADEGIRLDVRHAGATAGALMFPEAHFSMVRIGIGLYGLWPSDDIRKARKDIALHPVLRWKTVLSEVKSARKGDRVGYDLTETLLRDSRIAVLPVGYWHGVDRALSSKGYAMVRGMRCKFLGRVSMDMVVVDVTDVPEAAAGDEATIIGDQKSGAVSADEIAKAIGTINYEVVTRINPLIERIVV